jgi:hypothetical protein
MFMVLQRNISSTTRFENRFLSTSNEHGVQSDMKNREVHI